MRNVQSVIENMNADFRFENSFWNQFTVVHGSPLGGNWWSDGALEPMAEGDHIFDLYISWRWM